MKFAHLADCHIGSWRDPKLSNLSTEAFEKAIDLGIARKVDFVVIAGDLFNTSVPGIDKLKETTRKLKSLQDSGIRCYLIPGSHDFSPSGKTMLDVLEHAGLCVNVCKGTEADGKLRLSFTVDPKTGVKITGMLGRRASLDKSYYEDLDRSIEREEGFKIFLFHALLSELKPNGLAEVDSHPVSLLPKNFNYYAGGHPHFVTHQHIEGYGLIAYPGPLFPNNFKELEELKGGGFYIYQDGVLTWEPIQIHNVSPIAVDCDHLTPDQAYQKIMEEIRGKEFIDSIITLRISGTLASGRPTDIPFKDIIHALEEKGAYFVMKNTAALVSREFEEIKIDAANAEQVEEKLIKEHLSQNSPFSDETRVLREVMLMLSTSKMEGETVATFEKRVIDDISKILLN